MEGKTTSPEPSPNKSHIKIIVLFCETHVKVQVKTNKSKVKSKVSSWVQGLDKTHKSPNQSRQGPIQDDQVLSQSPRQVICQDQQNSSQDSSQDKVLTKCLGII